MKDIIAIIGAGNMGAAFYAGLHGKNRLRINLCDRNRDKLDPLDADHAFTDPAKAIAEADTVLLAVKPQAAKELLTSLSPALNDRLVISIMAGITLTSLQQMTRSQRVIRAMPNLGAQVKRGLTGWVASEKTETKDRAFAKELFYAVGEEIELQDEEQIDKITALSGSGPAYFFLLAELMTAKAIKEGFSPAEAALIAKETMIGSARLLESDSRTPEEWRLAVTSRGGITEAALRALKDGKIDDLFFGAIDRGIKRSQELNQ
ncbi:MAG: pyrroline-5-carboxylate reductase [Candidatus Peribacteraceae bacterium]|nr:pyrroline-5-carboxylate reductase [Candidatus Peribacteraceae bacterium]